MGFSLAPFLRPPAFIHITIVICLSRDWLQPTYTGKYRPVLVKINVAIPIQNPLVAKSPQETEGDWGLSFSFCQVTMLVNRRQIKRHLKTIAIMIFSLLIVGNREETQQNSKRVVRLSNRYRYGHSKRIGKKEEKMACGQTAWKTSL